MITEAEKQALGRLAESWNQFALLEDGHPDDLSEFRQAIHVCQNIIACRVARRADPDVWWTRTIPPPRVGPEAERMDGIPDNTDLRKALEGKSR
jgi:hypothetical protein